MENSNLFKERVEYKPFEYPIYYTEGWLKQMQAFWLHTEISMQGDVKDWNEKLNDSEKNLVGNILLGFAQTECAVSDYWTGMVTKWFQVFREVAHKAKNRVDVLAGVDEFLDQVTVLPPGEWDPSIRIEPPKNVPSQV